MDYLSHAALPAVLQLESKLFFNSTISQSASGCQLLTLDIEDFFLRTNKDENEYMRIHSKYFIGVIRKQYTIDEIMANDRFVYVKLKKGICGLRQAARLISQLETVPPTIWLYP